MRNFMIFLAFFALLPGRALADGKVAQWLGWYPPKAELNEFTRYNPHLENGTQPHPEAWKSDPWTPSVWIQQKQNGLALVRGFYQSDIIRDQVMEDDVPVITVGPNFYRLGGQEKQRVIASIDEVYGITTRRPNNVILLRDWHTRMDIGAFTARGLMLQ